MSYRDQIELWVSDLETKVASMRKKSQDSIKRIEDKIARLVDFAENEASEGQKIHIRRFLAGLESRTKSIDLSLEDVEKEVDKIYGEQSQNSTYYFSRRNRKKKKAAKKLPWSNMSLEEAEKEVDDMYGDQSKNDTWYSGKKKANGPTWVVTVVFDHGDEVLGPFSSEREARRAMSQLGNVVTAEVMKLEEAKRMGWNEVIRENRKLNKMASYPSLMDVQQQMDDLYGDQGLNETFYPSREDWEEDLDDEMMEASDFIDGEEYHLRSREFDEFETKEASYDAFSGKDLYSLYNDGLLVPGADIIVKVGSVPYRKTLRKVSLGPYGNSIERLEFRDGTNLKTNVDDFDSIKIASRLPGGMFEQVRDLGHDPEVQDVPEYFDNRQFTEYENREAMQPADEPGYFTPGEFSSWSERVDLDSYDHYPSVETHGYWGDEVDEMPHVIEDRDQGKDSVPRLSSSNYWND